MKLSEIISHDREKMEKMNRKQKLQFIWDYYKFPIIGIAAALFIGITAALNSIGRKDVIMYAVLVNSDARAIECDEAALSSLMENAGYDMSRKKIDIRTDLNMGEQYSPEKDAETLQVLTALFAISDMDIYVAPQYYFDIFARDDGFGDLSQILSEELMREYADRLYYYSENRPCGIILDGSSVLHKAGYYHGEVIIGIVGNALNGQQAADFLSELLKASR